MTDNEGIFYALDEAGILWRYNPKGYWQKANMKTNESKKIKNWCKCC